MIYMALQTSNQKNIILPGWTAENSVGVFIHKYNHRFITPYSEHIIPMGVLTHVNVVDGEVYIGVGSVAIVLGLSNTMLIWHIY